MLGFTIISWPQREPSLRAGDSPAAPCSLSKWINLAVALPLPRPDIALIAYFLLPCLEWNTSPSFPYEIKACVSILRPGTNVLHLSCLPLPHAFHPGWRIHAFLPLSHAFSAAAFSRDRISRVRPPNFVSFCLGTASVRGKLRVECEKLEIGITYILLILCVKLTVMGTHCKHKELCLIHGGVLNGRKSKRQEIYVHAWLIYLLHSKSQHNILKQLYHNIN